GGVAVVLTYLLLGELYPRRTARLATVLLACSPWALFLSMSLMSHVASLVAAVLAAWCVARLRRAPRVGWALLGGASIGIVGLIRPLEGVAVALLLGVWSLGARGRGVLRLWPSAALTLATIATGALTLPYNRALTGDARTFPVMEYMNATFGPGANDLGFGPNRGSGWEGLDPLPGHGPVDVLINANFNLFQTNTELLGWATGSLLPILLLLLVGRLRRPDAWMLACIAMVIGIHSLYYFSGGPDFGARYWYLILVPCLALAARGIETACERAGAEGGGRVVAGVSALVLTALLVFVPWRAADKYVHYRGMRPDLRTMVTEPAFRDGLILVRGHRHPDYASAVIYGNLDPATPAPIIAWDRTPAQRAELVAAYPTRRFWVIDGPTVTGDGYRVLAGPLTGDE
ncbi:MAG: glycosyltransferase family 39 protein, partial [Gemmatimonadetes bacterium]|nr:glycosyltransferase family 39 protein [Gemmatimonadota bacterium]